MMRGRKSVPMRVDLVRELALRKLCIRVTEAGTIRVPLSPDDLDLLREIAARHGQTPEECAADFLSLCIAEYRLPDDDAGPPA